MSFRFPGKTDETVLIKAMADGDMGAFAEIYKRYTPGLRRFVTGLIKDKAKAEDIVQNIFMRLMSSKPSFENGTAFRNWLFVCARNEVVSTLRSKWESQVDRVQVLPERISDGIQPEAMMPVLNSVLAKMPKKRSEVFRMSKLNGLSAEEIAARMGISVRTVQKHLELARREVSHYLN
ncbi:MAG: sigma-70 family RNA polymerase sigma factor [Bacteroidales bacterium]|nr:sigma-70 family RNA polymerase sigma factor [Bacteroidales bacterium]